MKILLLHQFFILETEPGGSRHLFLSRFFKKKGGEVKVIAGSVNYMSGRSKLSLPRLWKKEVIDGIEIRWVYCLPTLGFGLLGKLLCYVSFFALALPFVLQAEADVLISTSPPPTVVFLGWILHRLKKIPWILEMRDIWPEMITDLGIRENIFTRQLSRLMDFLYEQADLIVTLTFGLERILLEKGVKSEKLTTITNGVDPIFLQPAPGVSAEQLPLQKRNKSWIMYVGSMGRANQISTLVTVAESMKDASQIEFIFIGDGPERTHLEKEARQKGLSNVKFLGALPRQMVPKLLALADVCILTHAQTGSFHALLPNRLFDYMASGRPIVLCLKAGDASRVLEKAAAGFCIDPVDISSIKKTILSLIDNPKKARELGESGRRYVLEHFLRERLADRYYAILHSIANRRGLQ